MTVSKGRPLHRLPVTQGWLVPALVAVLLAPSVALTTADVSPHGFVSRPGGAIGLPCRVGCSEPSPASPGSPPVPSPSEVGRATGGPVGPPGGSGADAILQSIRVQNATRESGIAPGAWGQGPALVAVDAVHQLVLVVDSTSNSVTVYDANLSRQIAVLPTGLDPDGVVYAPSEGETFVSNYQSNTVTVINDTTVRVVGTIPIQATTGYIASGPGGMTYDPALGTIFVADRGHSTYDTVNITEIDPRSNSVVANLSVAWNPSDVVYDPVSEQLVVVDQVNGDLLGYNATTLSLEENVTVPGFLGPVIGQVDPSTGAVLVDAVDYAGDQSVQKYNATLAYEGGTNLSRYSTFPNQFAVVPSAGALLLTTGTEAVSVSEGNLSLGSVVATGACLDAGVYDPSSEGVYLLDACEDRTFLVNASSDSLVNSILSVGNLTAVSSSPSSGDLWVDNLGGDAVFSVNGTTLSAGAGVPVGDAPVAIEPDAAEGAMVVLSQGFVNNGSEVSPAALEVIPTSGGPPQTEPLTATGPGGGDIPLGLAVDPISGRAEVAQLVPTGYRFVLQLAAYDLANGTEASAVNLTAVSDSLYTPEQGFAQVVATVPNSSTLLVGDPFAPVLFGFNLSNASLAWSLPLPGPPAGATFDPVDQAELVSSSGTANMTEINVSTGRPIGTVPLAEPGGALAYDPSEEAVYVVENEPNNTIGGGMESFQASSLLWRGAVTGFGAMLSGVAFAPDTGSLVVAGENTGLLYVLGQPLQNASLTTSAPSIHPAQTVVLAAAASGGIAPYRASYSGLPTGCATANSLDLSCTPVRPGTSQVTVTLTDTIGASVSATAAIVVDAAPVVVTLALPSGVSLGGTSRTVAVGESLILDARVTSAGTPVSPSAALVNWTIAPSSIGTINVTQGPTVNVSFEESGNLTVRATAYFAWGTNASTVVFEVAGPPNVPPPVGPPAKVVPRINASAPSDSTGLEIAVGIGGAGALIAVGTLLLWRRRRGGPGESSSGPGAP